MNVVYNIYWNSFHWSVVYCKKNVSFFNCHYYPLKVHGRFHLCHNNVLTENINGTNVCQNISLLMERKFKQWWSIILLISTKRTITSHLNSLNIKKKQDIRFCHTLVWWLINLCFWCYFQLIGVKSWVTRNIATTWVADQLYKDNDDRNTCYDQITILSHQCISA